MKKHTAYVVVMIFNITIVYGQGDSAWINNWQKILISDSYSGCSNFNNDFQILSENLSLTTHNRPDSIIKQVNPDLIDSLFNSLKNSRQLRYDPLVMFDLDSIWLMNNAEKLWTDYSNELYESPEINSIAINTIKDYSKIKRSIWSLQGSQWSGDYPLVSVLIIKGVDTLSISSSGQYPFMLPWNVNGKAIYNSQISKLISQLIPVNIESNKSRLQGERFNYALIDRIYDSCLSDTIKFTEAKKRYKKHFKYIEKDFQIIHAEMSNMASIEWGHTFGRPAFEILLSDSTISNQIQFSTVFSRYNLMHSPKSIVRNKDKLIKRLSDNPVYIYALECEKCIGKIHWVKSKSLSRQAKRNFLRDIKDNGRNKGEFRMKFRNAIFFELTEQRSSSRSFSRWIFLNDGTMVLWQLRGDFLMNLPDDFTKNQGCICRTLKPKELIGMPNYNNKQRAASAKNKRHNH
ncbi:hypothetical protein [Carboxylicivirga sp. RSCT41]|uniref:hypothetical protein n=1 Tax=Carboxylicivirga agarovorans TaxID=3417570 RepID=UPI003D331474